MNSTKEEIQLAQEQMNKLQEKNEQAFQGGGSDRIAKQKQGGRLTARERLSCLLDHDSFVELDRFVVHRSQNFGMGKNKILGDGVITGYGKINGSTVYVYSQDFSVFGGSMSRTQANKILKIQDLALKMEDLLLVLMIREELVFKKV